MVALRPSEAGAHRVEDRVGVVGRGVERVEATSELLSSGSNSKSSVILAPAIRGARPDPRASGTSPRPSDSFIEVAISRTESCSM